MSPVPAPRSRRPPRADGYTLVGLLVLLIVAQVLVAVALPSWTQSVKREKEEELIFRGLQYAEAIRVFQRNFGRYPISLDELIENNPRSIRRLWEDPMTEAGDWGLVFAQGVPGQAGRADGRDLEDDGEGDDELDEEGRDLGGGTGLTPLTRRGRERERQARARPGEEVRGPIVGVFSKSEESAVKRFEGGSTYNSWKFTVQLLPVQPVLSGESLPRLNSRWVGRPFPEGIEPLELDEPEDLGPAGRRGPADTVREPTQPDREERRRLRRERRERRRRGDG